MPLVAQVVPTQPVPSQTLNVSLGNQPCQINVYAKDILVPVAPAGSTIVDPRVYEEATPLFVDLFLNDVLVIGGCLARNGVGVAQNSYLGFVGEVAIEDTVGNEDPSWQGLGSRFQLTYWQNA